MRKHDIWRQLQLYWFIIVIMYLIKCVKKKNKNGKHFWDLSLQEQCLLSSCLSLLLINTLQSKYHQIQGVVQKIKKKEIKMLINSLFQCFYFSGYFLNLLSLGSLSKLLLSRFFVVLPIFSFFWLLWLRRWPKGGMFISSYSSRSQVFREVRARTQGRDLKVGPWSSGVASRPPPCNREGTTEEWLLILPHSQSSFLHTPGTPSQERHYMQWAGPFHISQQ